MEQYTPRERSEIVEIYIQQNKSIMRTQRAFKKLKNVKSAPSKNTIKRLYEKFSTGEALSNPKRPNKSRPRRSAENIAAVRASVERSPRTSQKRRSQQLRMARSTLQRIIRVDLHLFPYKIQLTQRLLPADKPRRLEWAQRVIEMAEDDEQFWNKIIMSDEAHFTLNGTVNKQNCRIYATENPQEIQEVPLHDEKVTVWCGVSAKTVIGPFFFQNENGHAVTVNQERYRDMMTNFVMPIIRRKRMRQFWFQQDGAPPHTSRITIDFLKKLFPGRLMSKSGDLDWPPRSPDLTPPDFFLWGYLKSKVYVNKPRTVEELKDNIREEIAAIPAEMLAKTMENAAKRAQNAINARGGHLRDIIFKN